jgi:hypothetical protein
MDGHAFPGHVVSLILSVVLLSLSRSPASSAIWAIDTTVLAGFLSKDRQEWRVPSRSIEAAWRVPELNALLHEERSP